ncbi:RNA-processing protein [Candidatus Woesearchaeota archaeon]|nr:RNA-processing protein [Candidatus Woesearchaeota archaeon]
MFASTTRIPKERIAVLIGTKGQTKRQIENASNTKLRISQEGIVEVSSEDNFNVYITLPVVKAIARGFNPEKALTLLKENRSLEILNIQDYIGKSKKKIYSTKARLIGTQGKAWKSIERLTETEISVYGKTVSILGPTEGTLIARKAIEKLLQGSTHSKTYRFIEKTKSSSFH